MRNVIQCSSLLVLAVLPAYSQFLSFGLKAGVPLNTAYSTFQNGNGTGTAYDRRYILGPTAEVHLPFHLSFEVDALYRRSGFDLLGTFPPSSPSVRTLVNDWQIPVLAKYEMKLGPIRPFADGGFVYRRVTSSGALGPDNPGSVGVAIGGGIALKLLLLKISPEIRYTHWPTPPYTNGANLVTSTTNQADILVGFTF